VRERPGRRTGSPCVHLLCGLVAAGKTTYARRLAADLPAVRFSLDEWMLRLYGLRYDDPRYVARIDTCTELIWDIALQVLDLGHDVVLDWNQWSRKRRRTWHRRAKGVGYQAVLHHIDVSVETAIEQALSRADPDVSGSHDRDVSGSHPVDEAAVRHHQTIFEPPGDDEGIEIVTVSR